MANIKRLLNKKGWTGRELGILELTNMAVTFRQALEGKEPEPIIPPAQLMKMINSISDREQGRVYNGYIAIHEWLTVRYNTANAYFQQAQLQYRTLANYLGQAILAEDVYHYVEQLPAIMTQLQYDAYREERIEDFLRDEDGEDQQSNFFNLVERGIYYYTRKLYQEPRERNPLKAIRKKYISKPVKSKYILSRWNEIMGEGYYTIEDGSGRRSDQMTAEEWQAAITTPEMEKALKTMRAEDGSGRELISSLAAKRIVERARVIFNGGTERDADEAQQRREYEAGLAVPVKWHTYEEPPKDLTKWDIIEQDLLLEFYPADLDGSGDEYSESNFLASMQDFVEEFKELVAAILKDMDTRYFKGGAFKAADLPLEEWETTLISWRQLYEMDIYGERDLVNADSTLFDGNRRALYNGIAIMRPSDCLEASPRIDERGYYSEPDITHSLSLYTLEAFFTDAEEYADNVDTVEEAIDAFMESYYFLKGYNLSIDMIARYYDVPELDVFKLDLSSIELQLDAYNDLIPILYKKIHDTDYTDKELQAKKLQVLKDFFPELDYKAVEIPAENIKQAEELLIDFKAFRQEDRDRFYSLLCDRPEQEDSGEGA